MTRLGCLGTKWIAAQDESVQFYFMSVQFVTSQKQGPEVLSLISDSVKFQRAFERKIIRVSMLVAMLSDNFLISCKKMVRSGLIL